MILSMTRRFRHNSSWSSLDDAWSGRDCPTPNQSLTPFLRDGRLFRHSETAALGRAADLAAGPLPHLQNRRSRRRQRIQKVLNDIVRVLEAAGEPHEAIAYTELGARRG